MRRKMVFLPTLITCLVAAVAAGTAALAAPVQPLAAPAGLDHFKCYLPDPNDTGQIPAPVPNPVGLRDQFGFANYTIDPQPDRLCNPAQKTLLDGTVTPINNPDAHLVCHPVTPAPGYQFNPGVVTAANQFGGTKLYVVRPVRLCLPSFKQLVNGPAPTPTPFPLQPQPNGLDHFLCYETGYWDSTKPFPQKPATVGLKDQFENVQATIFDPVTLCNPVKKTLPNGGMTPIQNRAAHLVCLSIMQNPAHTPQAVMIKHQLASFELKTATPSELCLPSSKTVRSTYGTYTQSSVPKSLTLTQLQIVFRRNTTDPGGCIFKPRVPVVNSAVTTYWANLVGPFGTCVDQTNIPENTGAIVGTDPNVIAPYSVDDWLAQTTDPNVTDPHGLVVLRSMVNHHLANPVPKPNRDRVAI
ncbi:MAG TPA: hypothetical protein VFO16_05765 [Pseudonocardiaceae bacterium]|nr:hypothetical protein [Pseudonocardiaceae bacterium]